MEQTPCQALLLQINKHICQYQCIDQGVLHNAILYLNNDDCYLATCSEKSDLIDKQKAKIIDSPSNQEYKPTVPNNMTSDYLKEPCCNKILFGASLMRIQLMQ